MVHGIHPTRLFSEIAAIIFLNSPTPILLVNIDFYILSHDLVKPLLENNDISKAGELLPASALVPRLCLLLDQRFYRRQSFCHGRWNISNDQVCQHILV